MHAKHLAQYVAQSKCSASCYHDTHPPPERLTTGFQGGWSWTVVVGCHVCKASIGPGVGKPRRSPSEGWLWLQSQDTLERALRSSGRISCSSWMFLNPTGCLLPPHPHQWPGSSWRLGALPMWLGVLVLTQQSDVGSASMQTLGQWKAETPVTHAGCRGLFLCYRRLVLSVL